MFKKKPEIKKEPDYTNWEKDFGFLTLITNRKKGISKEFLIATYNRQKAETDYLTDEEIEPVVSKIVFEIIGQLGKKYKDFLVDKYFGTDENLISYISEDVYVDLVSDTINRNVKKITSNLQKKIISSISGMNKKD